MSATVAAAKRALRRRALAQRRLLDIPEAAGAAAAHLLQAVDIAPGDTVAGYAAMRGELDPRPALLALEARGCRTVLPYTTGRGEPLRFLEAPGGVAESIDALGIAAPPASAAEFDPDLLLVPLAAFDRRGYRLGYGGGFYDAALARLRAEGTITAVGWAFAAQEVEAVPAEPHDARLDWIVTEREAIYISA
ncbi:MAG: 5-formyltetrahydrofolate cyclo-ligase [Rhodospirillaceae bacterium]|nr:5-formyltetrahydrofolate cyclo-ligase [Rhodospirillaceae bacterium]